MKDQAKKHKEAPQGFDFEIKLDETYRIVDRRTRMEILRNSTDEERKEFLDAMKISDFECFYHKF